MTQIIVGVDDSERAADAVALATALARTAGAELLIAHAYPFEPLSSHVSLPVSERRPLERAAGVMERHLDAAAGVPARIAPLPGGSPARQLQGLAEREGAAAIVIGSSHRGDVARVLAGTTAERLLHGAPCPVLVAPRGYAGGELQRILVGHDGEEAAQDALEVALAVPRHQVRLVRVLERGSIALQPSMAGAWIPPADIEAAARDAFQADFAELGDAVQREFVVGDAVSELVRRTADADLAIVGSRGYGPLRSVLLGSVSAQLVRHAECPIMVVPRGAGAEAVALLAGSSATAQAL